MYLLSCPLKSCNFDCIATPGPGLLVAGRRTPAYILLPPPPPPCLTSIGGAFQWFIIVRTFGIERTSTWVQNKSNEQVREFNIEYPTFNIQYSIFQYSFSLHDSAVSSHYVWTKIKQNILILLRHTYYAIQCEITDKTVCASFLPLSKGVFSVVSFVVSLFWLQVLSSSVSVSLLSHSLW